MNESERTGDRVASKSVVKSTDQLALYDRYGSMAYGIILQIVPQPRLAQEVLVDLFASPDIQSYVNYPGNVAVSIIRLAREKALNAKTKLAAHLPTPTEPAMTNENLPEVVFNLSFRHSYSLDAIAEKFQLARTDVLKAIHNYLSLFRRT